jgi:LmbE family N-acetylglucosaminyl deacetylase
MLGLSRILFLGAHPDDLELAAGGLISQLAKQDAVEFRVAIFSDCNSSLPAGFPANTLINEFYNSMGILGVDKSKLTIFNYPVRCFTEHRQDILQDLIDLRNDFNPELVFAPSKDDVHQDHSLLGHETIRAFKLLNLFEYTHPWNISEYAQNSFFQISELDLDTKISAIGEYVSQSNRAYCRPESISGIASFYGAQAGLEFAEGFRSVRINMSSK